MQSDLSPIQALFHQPAQPQEPLTKEPDGAVSSPPMNDRTTLGLGVLVMAVLLGLWGDALLEETPWGGTIPWGVNVFVWTGALVASSICLVRWRRVALAADWHRLVLPALLFAAAFAWRDSPTLKALDAGALLVAFALALVYSQAGNIRLAGLMEYAFGVVTAGFNTLVGSGLLLSREIEWKSIPRHGWSQRAMAVGRGLAIALPLLLVFGGLFAAADAVFEGIVTKAFAFDFESLFGHGVLIVFYAWIAGGFLHGMLLGREPAIKPGSRPNFLSLGIVEIGVVLGLLDALFLSFVIVQFRYFFGGAARVVASTGLTYAEYARRGFFELVAVSALVLPLLLFAHWLLRKENPASERIFRVLAGTQVLLLFVIMASAAQRMRLYQSEYGLTELRLYTTALMGWLAVVFVWFAVTVLRGRRERFGFGALVSGFLVIGLLHLLNPDALIVRTNVAHAKAGRSFDAGYTTSLSADAVPALMAALPALSTQDRSIVAARTLERWTLAEHSGWRTWSWSRSAAWRAVRENGATLTEIARRQKEQQP